MLLAVPNVSEGRDATVLEAIGAAFAAGGARVLDVHADRDHHRAVFTLAGPPGELADAVLAGAREALARIDVSAHNGVHPRVGALDVAPVVHLDADWRGAACAEALVLGDLLGRELGLPVLLYGALAGGRFGRLPGRRTDTGLRPGPAPDRERPRRLRLGLSSDMAQTKRKRRSKHRGTAAGTVESRGRTGRKPDAKERGATKSEQSR